MTPLSIAVAAWIAGLAVGFFIGREIGRFKQTRRIKRLARQVREHCREVGQAPLGQALAFEIAGRRVDEDE